MYYNIFHIVCQELFFQKMYYNIRSLSNIDDLGEDIVQYYPQRQQPPYPAQPYPQQYQQPPMQQSPQQPQGYPMQQVYPAQFYPQPQMTPEQQQEYLYKRSLGRTTNSLGTLLLIFFGLEIIISLIAEIILLAVGMESELYSAGELFLLLNGMVSSLIFFFTGLIYCLIRQVRFATIFPFDKIKGTFLAQLCVIGLAFSLMSNYVVSLINNTFGLFGIENNGGSFDVGSEPNVLLYFLTVAVLPAFAEEFAFRGIIMGSLRSYSEGLAILISSAAFALMHGNFVQLPFTFCCGLVFAYMDIKTNSLLPSIIIHFFNNGLSVLFEILTSYQIMSNNTANMCYGIIFVITGVLSFIFIKRIVKSNNGSLFRLEGGNDFAPFKSKVKTSVSSPTLISFAVVMLLYCVFSLIQS